MFENVFQFIVNTINHRFNYIYKSLILNYKSWFLILLSFFVIDKNNLSCYASFILMLFVAHIAHYFYHIEFVYPLNVVHLYHHSHNNFFSHFIQILLEFNSLLYVIFFKYLVIFQYGINILPFINDWIIVFFYFFYTTVHNINYSIFHVNHIHEFHHKNFMYNIGPDISDIILGTKFNPDVDLENTDHYIFNIIGSTILVLLIKFMFSINPYLKNLFFILYIIGVIILIFYSIVLFNIDFDNYIKHNLHNFKNL